MDSSADIVAKSLRALYNADLRQTHSENHNV